MTVARTGAVEGKSAENSGVQSWFASVFGNVQCCTQRERPEGFGALNKPTPRPLLVPTIALAGNSAQGDEPDSARNMPDSARIVGNSILDMQSHISKHANHLSVHVASHLADAVSQAQSVVSKKPEVERAEDLPTAVPMTKMPHNLPKKVAAVIGKDPYMRRQIGEMAQQSRRFTFLKHAVNAYDYGGKYDEKRCDEIWTALDESDRKILLQTHLLQLTLEDSFYMNIVEPDYELFGPSDCFSNPTSPRPEYRSEESRSMRSGDSRRSSLSGS